ncbi:prepilin-type N-terminal cleavage/methylation domain-containing protein [Rariglobus hedericola]|uniref:Prepilin-type N-terminal cleavage/methylation domain-containing protein n=1 Tax=Rariglobus hedericola TaxID=2597822 RepID=A0A556QEL0_9BACT|nr:prepilin-type N-terminal cleavage/methylation domain-containing protein [Rariglobus hedericola]TSJ75082.1 prepilin-type N-terminal cleavage/methylation domain-containing protein [Rariglobus hedericola]
MNARKSAPHASHGFTLVELLTVIAIIGILAAILIPVVGSARRSAQTSACAANLRQLSLAVILYAQDNRGTLPAARTSSGAWSGLVRGIRDPSPGAAAVSFSDTSRQLSNFIARYLEIGRSSQIWLCPGNTAVQDATTQDGASPNNRMSYLLNNRGQGFATNSKTAPENFFGNDAGTPEQLRPKTLLEIDNGAAAAATSSGQTSSGRYWNTYTGRSNIWMISDMDSVNYSNSTSYIPAAGAADEVPMPHGGGRNYAFFDGHVELRKAADLPANP